MWILLRRVFERSTKERGVKTKNPWKLGMSLRASESAWHAETGGPWEGMFNSAQIGRVCPTDCWAPEEHGSLISSIIVTLVLLFVTVNVEIFIYVII